MQAMHHEISREIEQTDEKIRAMHAGSAAEEVEREAKKQFARICIELQPNQVREYAAAVAAGAPFEWRLS